MPSAYTAYKAIVTTSRQEPTWYCSRRFHFMAIPIAMRNWLFDQHSLTQRLIIASDNRFRVQVLSQRWCRPNRSEAIRLQLPTRQLAIVREVILYGDDRPWVYARSVLPHSTLTGSLRALKKLDNRPLGALLFNTPGMYRSAIEVASFRPNNSVIPQQYQGAQTLWGRRSIFYLQHKPLLVSEIFLPEFTP